MYNSGLLYSVLIQFNKFLRPHGTTFNHDDADLLNITIVIITMIVLILIVVAAAVVVQSVVEMYCKCYEELSSSICMYANTL